jgi:hypothetical protein
MTIAIDAKMSSGITHQWRARNFPTTTGQVLESKVSSRSGGRGSRTYDLNIRYRYVVDDKIFESGRYRYSSSFSSWNARWAEEAVATRRVGSEIPVFYNPADPRDAVLSPGLGGEDLFLLLFLTPFNMITLGIFYATAASLRNWISPQPAGGVKILLRPPQLRVRLPKASPWGALPVVTALAFVSIIPVALLFGGHPSLRTMEVVWLLLIATGAAIFARRWIRIRSGAEDLVIDENSNRIFLPLTWGRKEPVAIERSEVQGITVEKIALTQNQGRTMFKFAPTLHFRGQAGGAAKLAEWADETRANAFVTWLQEQLGVRRDA